MVGKAILTLSKISGNARMMQKLRNIFISYYCVKIQTLTWFEPSTDKATRSEMNRKMSHEEVYNNFPMFKWKIDLAACYLILLIPNLPEIFIH